jgi:hypothetical protein
LELTLSGEAPNNAAKLLDHRSRVNFGCKYILFLVQISVQMNNTCSFLNRHVIVDTNTLNDYELAGLVFNALGEVGVSRWNFDGVARLENEFSIGVPGFHAHRAFHAEKRVCNFTVKVPGHTLSGSEAQLADPQTRRLGQRETRFGRVISLPGFA